MTQRLVASASTASDELKTNLLRLQAELKQRSVRAGPHSIGYIKRKVSDLCQLRGSRFADLRFDCLSKCVPLLYANKEFEAAIQACSEMASLARITGRRDWLRLAENCAGAVEGERGNVAQTVVHYAAALFAARELGDAAAEGMVLANLGIALQYSGLYRDAVPCHVQALQLAAETKCASLAGSIYTNLAQTYLAIGDLDHAHATICTALSLAEEPTDLYTAHRRVIREWTYVDIALERMDLAGARQHLSQCLHYSARSSNASSVFLAKLAQGSCEVVMGSCEDGLNLLEQSFQESQQRDDEQCTDAMVALVKAYQRSHRPESALIHLNKFMRKLADRRKKQIAALLDAKIFDAHAEGDYMDLHAWKYREAQLRAAVLEHEVVSSRQEMLERLATTATLKEDPSGEHGYRVGKLSGLVAEQIGWSKDRCYLIETAARLHDIGKVGVPDRILLGSQELQDAERQFMQSHTTIGAELLAKSDELQLKMAEEIALCHHEWWNGAGYPSGLSGARIPLHARIVALADVFDALTHGRPYAAAWSVDDALAQIERLAGSQFEPELSTKFIRLVRQLTMRHRDLDQYLGASAHGSMFLQARKKLKSLLQEQHEKCDQAAVA